MSTRRTEEKYYTPDKAKTTARKTAREVQAEKRRDRPPTDSAESRHCATAQLLHEEAMNSEGEKSELGTSDGPIFQSEEMAEAITQENFQAQQTASKATYAPATITQRSISNGIRTDSS